MDHDSDALTFEVDRDNVGWLTFDQPDSKVNLLTSSIMQSLDRTLGELESRIATGKLVAVVLRSGKPTSFIAGADVREIAGIEDREDARDKSREGQRIFRRLDRLTVPTVAAVNGTCLGGGTEAILACRYRIASDAAATRIGLPEVRLGILPGFGGSVRLPPLVGIQSALDMILTGRSLSAKRAKRIGLVDRVAQQHRFDEEIATFLKEILGGRVAPRDERKSFTKRLFEDTGIGRRLLFAAARKRTESRTRGRFPAPLRALRLIEETHGLQIDRALAMEADALAELAITPESRNLVRIFLLQQNARRKLDDLEATASDVKHAVVVGAGVMGGSIAELIAAHDIPVMLKDIEQEALDEGLRHANDLLRQASRKGVFSEGEAGLKFALIKGTLTYEGMEEADLVIEAVVERLAVKQQVLRDVEEMAGDDVLFATNTSSLSVGDLAASAERPERVLGLHFFNPVHRMPLVEVVKAERTSDAALATGFDFVLRVGKTPVLVADRPGFLVNRLLAPYLNEVGYLIEDGADIRTIDGALEEFGMPMGPCRLLDEIGFDVAEHVAREMERAFGERMPASRVVEALRQDGRLGKKNGRGFYRYERGRRRGVDAGVAKLLGVRAAGTPPDRTEIRERCLYLMVNEAARALEEEVVESAGEVDLAMVMGIGFPPFRGGLLRWADNEGLSRIAAALSRFEERKGPRFAAAELLRSMASEDLTFTDPG